VIFANVGAKPVLSFIDFATDRTSGERPVPHQVA
jgi:hypothetical protein